MNARALRILSILCFLAILPFFATSALAETCEENDDCAASEFCAKQSCDAEEGECAQRPEACITLFDPVCGCDGRTYSNACFAAQAGANVAFEGECPANCEENADCAPDELCLKPQGECDDEGRCEERPDFCILVFDPVCGCDGQTYSNSCFAAQAGTSVEEAGACEEEDDDDDDEDDDDDDDD